MNLKEKALALKTFFGSQKPVKVKELSDLRKSDKSGFDELAEAASKALQRPSEASNSNGPS